MSNKMIRCQIRHDFVSLLLIAAFIAPPFCALAEFAYPQVEVRDGWFYVDGEKIFIKGVCFFENHMVDNQFGRSSLEVIDHEFKRIKQAGFNAIRSQLTAPEIELANRNGLLVMQAANHLFFSHEYTDPQVIDRECRITRTVAQATQPYGNVLYYILDNEPQLKEGIYRQGEGAFCDFQRRLIGEVKAGDPRARVSMASYPPAAFLDYTIYDIVSLNAYPICPAKKSIGYRGYLRWFKQQKAAQKPLIISEYGWEIDQGEAGMSEAVLSALDQQIQAGAVGSFFYTWRTFGPEGQADNRWYGVLPNQGRFEDYRGQARSLYDQLKTYFEAVVIKPTPTHLYCSTIPFEIYGTERTGSIEVLVKDVRFALQPQGTYWWQGELPADPSWQGDLPVQIISRDRQHAILTQKQVMVHFSPTPAYQVRMINPQPLYHAGDFCRMTIRVENREGQKQPGLPLRIGINQTADMWGSQNSQGVTDAQGEYQLVWGPLMPGHITVMATVDQESQDLIEPGVWVMQVNKE